MLVWLFAINKIFFREIQFIRSMANLPNSTQLSLHNSAYLSRPRPSDLKLSKAQQIIRQQQIDSPIKINETNQFKSRHSHHFEADLITNILQENTSQTFQSSLDLGRQMDSLHPKQVAKLDNSKLTTSRRPIFRPCMNNVPKQVEDYATCDTATDEQWRRKRDQLAARARSRKIQQLDRMRQQTYERILFQSQEETESVIHQEVDPQEIQLREHRIKNFIARQKFSAQQAEVLRQMREFCLYGSIKLSSKCRIF